MGGDLWASKKGEERNYLESMCCLIVKNHGPIFSLLNHKGENEKMECLLGVFAPGVTELVF